ncbi:putative enoyl-CoA hydratase domain-containing protein 3, mitochondrial-like [Apostichopus japonicus]|uniref:Putative enoyl-CoA hydratase domain-containing protein 3, mitochondrial-like n=1 Tax=Stichopus japonicus TaxID=307972 RepID=A0A2G8KM22_STIJA|nr:putative enoyl-CoA hydratase domain-containing protein 3, mitochondrial-like [Apostichopus japonicus]
MQSATDEKIHQCNLDYSSQRLIRGNRQLRYTGVSKHLKGLHRAAADVTKVRTYSCHSNEDAPSYETLLYHVKDKVAYITLNRPEHLNAINSQMPGEIQSAVKRANVDDNVKVIILGGSGRAFCAGYDLKMSAENERGEINIGNQKMPWDPLEDFRALDYCTKAFMSLWHSYKPTIAKVHGYGIAGGSDIALCADMVIMAENAKIGYPPARVWGCPTTAMWTFRVGPEKAKRMMLTGDLITGKEAAEMGLVLEVAEQMGLFQAQRLATLLDGMTRHSPEGVAFQKYAMEHGFKKAVKLRDSGEMDWTEEADKHGRE